MDKEKLQQGRLYNGSIFFWKHVKQEKDEQLQDTFFWRYQRILSNFCVEGKLFLDQSVK